jgi:excinuclease ABC subunit A
MNGGGARRDEAPVEPRIEHTRKRELIKPVLSEVEGTADWVLDLGPEGGDKGGEVVAEGTPEQVAQEPRSYTGGYLNDLLSKSVRAGPVKASSSKKKRASSVSMRQRVAAE